MMADYMEDDPTLDTDARTMASITQQAGALAASYFGEKYEQWEKALATR